MGDHGGAQRHGSAVRFALPGYQHVAELARGGSSVVFRAWQPDFDRWVAIKVVAVGSGAAPLAQFERERKAIGMLSGHPNIVTVYDGGLTADFGAFIVMEHLPDGTLADRVRGGPLDWADAAVVGVGVSGALESAHRSGVLHLDVKPENVFLSSDLGTVKLGDFGVARIEGRAETGDGLVRATLLHIAAERLDGAPGTAASDVYSLGSTLFTMVRGRPPFGRADEPPGVVMGRILHDRAPIDELRDQGVPASFCRVVERALSRQPADRQAGAGRLGEELRAVQAEEGLAQTPLVVRAPSRQPPQRGVRPGRYAGGADTLPPQPTPAPADGPAEAPIRRRPARWKVVAGSGVAVVVTALVVAVVLARAPFRHHAAIAFRDDFSNTSTGWPDSKGDAFYDGQGAYRIMVRTAHNNRAVNTREEGGPPALAALAAPGVNVRVEVDAGLVSDPPSAAVGVFCRSQPTSKDRYQALIFPNGFWQIQRDSRMTDPVTLASGHTTFARRGDAFRVGFDCEGDGRPVTLRLHVGGKPVGEYTDRDGLAGGGVGLVAITANAPSAEAHLDNFAATRR